MSNRLPLYLTLPLIIIGCATKPVSSPVSPRYAIDETIKTHIPESPFTRLGTFRNVGTTSTTNAIQRSTSEFSQIVKIEKFHDARKLKVSWDLERTTGAVVKDGKRFEFTDDKILRKANLSAKVDCSNRKIIERSGFQQTLDRIEKEKPRGEEQDFLIRTLTERIEAVPGLCAEFGGPFDYRNFAGKRPGDEWQESVPVPGFEKSRFNAKFLGWHRNGDQTFAVIHGHIDDKTRITEDGEGGELHMAMESYLLVSSDWKKTIQVSESRHGFIPDQSNPISGEVKISVTSERLP